MTCRLGLALVSIGLLTGCITLDPVADSTRYYVLPGPAIGSIDGSPEALRIGLHPLTLPPYLDRREIVVQHGASEILYQDDHRWADGLAVAMQRSLIQHLRAQTNLSEVVPSPWGRAQFDRELTVTIEECQGADDGAVRLSASWEIHPSKKKNRTTLAGTYPPGDIPALVEELGKLIAQLATEIAAALSPEAE